MNKKTEIYQLCPNEGYLMHSYLIKTPNNKIVMIDGGHTYYMQKAYLPHAIRAILGLKEKDYFEIEAWFFSHAHDDHYGEFVMMMREYDQNSNYKINNIYFDFPDFAKSSLDKDDYSLEILEQFKSSLDKYAKVNGINFDGRYYDYLNGRVINADSVEGGLTVKIDGVNFDILQTWDDLDLMVNSNSTIIRVSQDVLPSKTCLFLNDASIDSGARLLEKYGNKLKSDMVQMAHHGQAGVDKDVYDAISATIRFWPTPFWVWNDHEDYKTDQVRSWLNITEFEYTEGDVIACLYKDYPEDYTKVSEWKKCINGMKREL